MEGTINIFCDGGSRGNPGNAACAFVVEKDGMIIFSDSKFLGKTTNNVAEYNAVILALSWIKENKNKFTGKINFVLDSELVTRQINGVYRVKSQNIKKYFKEVIKLIKEINLEILFTNVSRARNARADFLVNKVLDNLL